MMKEVAVEAVMVAVKAVMTTVAVVEGDDLIR